jgi:hypothetical protein
MPRGPMPGATRLVRVRADVRGCGTTGGYPLPDSRERGRRTCI